MLFFAAPLKKPLCQPRTPKAFVTGRTFADLRLAADETQVLPPWMCARSWQGSWPRWGPREGVGVFGCFWWSMWFFHGFSLQKLSEAWKMDMFWVKKLSSCAWFWGAKIPRRPRLLCPAMRARMIWWIGPGEWKLSDEWGWSSKRYTCGFGSKGSTSGFRSWLGF